MRISKMIGQKKGRERTRGLRIVFDLVSRSAMTAASAPTPAWPSASTTTSSASARSSAPSAIPTAIGPISGRPLPAAGSSDSSDRVAVKVGLIVGEIAAALDGQRRLAGNIAVTRHAAVWSRLAAAHFRALLLKDGLPRKADAIALNRKHFHQHLIAFFKFITHILDAMLSHFADVEQPVSPRNDFDECTEIRQAGDSTEIGFPYLCGSRQVANNLQRLIRRGFIVRSHVDFAGIFNVDLHPGLFDDRANHFATGPNHVANLIDGNLQGVNSRRISRDFFAMLGNPLAHLVEDM